MAKNLKDVVSAFLAILNTHATSFKAKKQEFLEKVAFEHSDISDVIKWNYESLTEKQYRYELGQNYFVISSDFNIQKANAKPLHRYVEKIISKIQKDINLHASQPVSTSCIIWTRNERIALQVRGQFLELIEGFRDNIENTVEFTKGIDPKVL